MHVQQGVLEGQQEGQVLSFKGIPFAAPPVGELRWRPPQPAAPWSGIRPALRFGAACKQDLVRSMLPWTEEFMHHGEDSEDCLTLNVWTPNPQANGSAKLPVYVFVHGGAFQQGSTSVAVYDGAALAARGVIVVTIQYRLGVFGFFAHPALTAESPNHASGNYGLLDCLAALGWIKENIADFGGDPAHVTVGGQSAGAAAVHDLLASPLARGLIAGAIAESGSALGPPLKPLETAEQDGVAFASAKGTTSLAALRALSAAQLLAPVAGARFGPVVDGWSVPEDPNAAIAAGHVLDVPVLTGMQADEGSSSVSYGHSTAAALAASSAKMFDAQAPSFATLYPFSDDAAAASVAKASARDRGLASMDLWATLTAAHVHSPIYTYYWAHALPWPEHPEFASFHSSEVPYVFGTLNVLHRPFTAEDRALSAEAGGWWVNFIRSGDPNGPGLPHWGAFDAAKPETLEINTDAHMRPLMSAERLAFWTKVLAPSIPHSGETSYTGTPYTDAHHPNGPQAVPGRVECAFYDRGGEGVAYHDTDPQNRGSGGLNPADGSYLNEFRMAEGVDTSYTKYHDTIDNSPFEAVKPPEGLLYVGWTEPGEWFRITVNVARAGLYRADLLYTSNRGGTLSLDVNGQDATGPLPIRSTFNAADPIAWRQWHHWDRMTGLAQLRLPAGKNVLTVHILSGGNMNLQSFDFTPVNQAGKPNS